MRLGQGSNLALHFFQGEVGIDDADALRQPRGLREKAGAHSAQELEPLRFHAVSLTSLAALLARHDLVVHDVERIAIHGGSLRLYVGRSGSSSRRAGQLLDEEAGWGVGRPEFYASLAQRIERLRGELVALLRQLKGEGRRIAVYGASAKGSTLLNYFNIGRDLVDFVVDRNTFKQGRYTPGAHAPILGPDQVRAVRPDYVLILPWNLKAEIMGQLSYIGEWGGRFVIASPRTAVVG